MQPPDSGWYAVQTKPRQEQLAADNLLRQNFTTYLPKLRTSKHLHGRWTPVVEPLFPRYLFIQVNPNEHNIAPVRSTLGVAKLVKFGAELISVPQRVIDYLRENEDPETSQISDQAPRFKKGEQLEILDGPFRGLNGIYEVDSAADRALVLISLLGRDSKVAIHHDALRQL